MRTKDEILDQSHKDITLEKHKEDARLWLEVRKIEALIDIRDIHSQALVALDRICEELNQLL